MFWLVLWLAQNLLHGSIEGVLVHSVTGQPLSGLTVELRPAGMTHQTDAAGRFVFPAVPAGHYTLAVEEGSLRAHVPFSLEPGQTIREAVVRVSHSPGIFGTVFDARGERLAAARVHAYRMVYTANGRRLRTVKSVFTDDFGDYRLFWLEPGEYYVAASYLEADRRVAVSGFRLSPNVAKRDDHFTTMYFGGSFTPAESQRIVLRAGSDAAGVNVYFRDVQRYAVRGSLLGLTGPVCARIAMLPEGSIFNEETDYVRESCGSFEIPNVSPGSYVLLAQGAGMASDIVRVNVATRDITGLPVLLRPTVTVEGRITTDGVRDTTRTTKVILTRYGREIEQRYEAAVNGDGRFSIADVGPGEYEVAVDPLDEKTYIKSIRTPSRDVLSSGLRINNFERGRLDLQLSSAGGTIHGIVRDRLGRPAAGAQVVLVPETLRNREDRYRTAISDLRGNFQVDAIPPGGYIALAFESLEPRAYLAFGYNPSLYARYAGKGATIAASISGQQPVQLIAIPAEETSGGLE